MLNTMHLFAGRGGGLLADLILGHNPIIAVEWNHEACENLREKAVEGWYPDLHVWEGDVRLFDPSKYKDRVVCIHAGFPCQDISQAGKQAGLGEGTRSGLYREVLRIAGAIGPKVIFLENVAAIINNGLGTVLADLSKMGYNCRWCVVSASDVGANHQRDRWWCLAVRNINGIQKLERGQSEQVGTKDVRQWPNNRSRIQSNDKQHTKKITSTNIIRNVANTDSTHLERNKLTKRKEQKYTNNSINGWWSTESTIRRVVDGIPDKLHTAEINSRLFGLGNAQVPLAAAVAWKILTKDLIILKGNES